MLNSSYAPHYAINSYSIREFNTGTEHFMVAMIIIIIITSDIEETVVVDTSASDISPWEEATNNVVIDVDASKGFVIWVKKS